MTLVDRCVPAELMRWLDDWGPGLKQRVTSAIQQASGGRFSGPLPASLSVGTDCSGIEAPIHALRGLGVCHRHCWSSELHDAPRQVLLANTPPSGQVFVDVLDFGPQALHREYVQLYVSGFSCKPFSRLHHGSKLLDEPQAQIFWAVARRILLVRPACFLLENVEGIRRVQSEVVKALRAEGLHMVQTLKMDPRDLGEPLSRPRIYFFGIRSDVARVTDKQLGDVLEKAWGFVKSDVKKHSSAVHLETRLLPHNHPAVVAYQDFRRTRWLQAGGGT